MFFELPRQVVDYHKLCGIVPSDYSRNTDAFEQMNKSVPKRNEPRRY